MATVSLATENSIWSEISSNGSSNSCSILIVSITSKKNKYDNVKIFFDDKTRANRIAELDFVDYVTISPYPNAFPVIIDIKPNIYCKGIEYKNYKPIWMA